MTDWKGQTVDGTFAVVLQAPVLRDLDCHCRKAGSSETGGILIGRYSDDLSVAIVLEATPPPPDSRRGRSWFVRGANGLRTMLGRRRRAKERTYYLGEWHFHPAAHVEPSGDDFTQMLSISRAKNYECREPVLLILGRPTEERGARPVRAYVFPAGEKPMELRPEALEPPSGQAGSEDYP